MFPRLSVEDVCVLERVIKFERDSVSESSSVFSFREGFDFRP